MTDSERLKYVVDEYLAGHLGNLMTDEIEECREAEADLRRYDAMRRKEKQNER